MNHIEIKKKILEIFNIIELDDEYDYAEYLYIHRDFLNILINGRVINPKNKLNLYGAKIIEVDDYSDQKVKSVSGVIKLIDFN